MVNDPATVAELLKQVQDEFDCPKMTAMFKRYLARNVPFEWGRTRVAFLFPTYVVKLPVTYAGIGDNDWEGSVSNIPGDTENIQYARTRLHYEGEIPVLLMERVEWQTTDKLIALYGEVPWWVDFVDCGQVGLNRRGRLVAFDYGRN